MMRQKNIFYGSCLLLSVLGFTSCIDEDLSDCPPATKDAEILYKLCLLYTSDAADEG